MSYSIYYRSLFVKTQDNKYIPIIESGDNNVWECDNKRRHRSWCNVGWMTKNERFLLTETEVMQAVEQMIESVKQQWVGELTDKWDKNCTTRYTDKDVEQKFGYFEALALSGKSTFATTAQMVRNFFKRAIENAASIDDVGLDVHWCTDYPNYEHRHTHTEEELLAAIKEGQDAKCHVWIGFSAPWDVERILDRQKVTVKRTTKEHTTGFVVTICGRYITKATSRKFFSGYYLGTSHIYTTRASAEKLHQRILRSNYPSEIIQVRKNDEGRWERAA